MSMVEDVMKLVMSIDAGIELMGIDEPSLSRLNEIEENLKNALCEDFGMSREELSEELSEDSELGEQSQYWFEVLKSFKQSKIKAGPEAVKK